MRCCHYLSITVELCQITLLSCTATSFVISQVLHSNQTHTVQLIQLLLPLMASLYCKELSTAVAQVQLFTFEVHVCPNVCRGR